MAMILNMLAFHLQFTREPRISPYTLHTHIILMPLYASMNYERINSSIEQTFIFTLIQMKLVRRKYNIMILYIYIMFHQTKFIGSDVCKLFTILTKRLIVTYPHMMMPLNLFDISGIWYLVSDETYMFLSANKLFQLIKLNSFCLFLLCIIIVSLRDDYYYRSLAFVRYSFSNAHQLCLQFSKMSKMQSDEYASYRLLILACSVYREIIELYK